MWSHEATGVGISLDFQIFSAFPSIFLVLIIQKPKLLYITPVQLKLPQFALRNQKLPFFPILQRLFIQIHHLSNHKSHIQFKLFISKLSLIAFFVQTKITVCSTSWTNLVGIFLEKM